MTGHDIIVIGASAGGVEALMRIAAELPGNLAASVFVAVHLPSGVKSALPDILNRAGPLPAAHPVDGEEIEPARIYVAPPDHHLLVEPGRVRVARGPRENGLRPAADPLFRSAAAAYGGRVVAVVLTGNLDDGTAGMRTVVEAGGVGVAQDPAEALYPGMPTSAIAAGIVRHVTPIAGVAPLLRHLAGLSAHGAGPVQPLAVQEAAIAAMDADALASDDRPGEPSPFACPECGGVLFGLEEGGNPRFRCRVGHAYGADSLLTHQAYQVEAALWTAYRALKERAALCRSIARRSAERGQAQLAETYREQARDADEKSLSLHHAIAAGLGRAHIPGPTVDDADALADDGAQRLRGIARGGE